MSQRSAIVIGGGIGGLATAAGLLRTGWRVTVLEQAPRFEAVGAGITLEPNAVRALDWLGAGSALRQHGAASGAAGLRTAAGRWLVRTTIDQLTAATRPARICAAPLGPAPSATQLNSWCRPAHRAPSDRDSHRRRPSRGQLSRRWRRDWHCASRLGGGSRWHTQ
jgi:choline dehydrogenase-like flavoprotein